MTINLSVPETDSTKPKILVVGVGGAGGNAVNNMIDAKLTGVEFLVANTDAQSLVQSLAERKLQLGHNITHGLGAGSRPDIGRAAAEETLDEIAGHLAGANMVFITAGMGGGTGTGAAPVIARLAREQGVLAIGVVTKPFQFEGSKRSRVAEAGIEELQKHVDTLIVIPNQNLFRVANEKTTFADAFALADDVLHSGVRGITDLMVVPGLINLDFADVRTVMGEMGKAMMGTGEADGEERAKDAAEAAISNPLLDEVSMKGARGVLINITGGPDMTLYEVDQVANRIGNEVDPEAHIIFGSTLDPVLEGRMRVSVVATGIDADVSAQPRPVLSVVPDAEAQLPPVPVPEPTPDIAAEPTHAIDDPPSAGAGEYPAVGDAAAMEGAEAPAAEVESAAAQETFFEGAREPAAEEEPADMSLVADSNMRAATERAVEKPQRSPQLRRRPSLLERMAGVGQSRKQQNPVPVNPEPAEVSPPEPTEAAKPASRENSAAAASPAPRQPEFEGVEPASTAPGAVSDEDLLDIPAFLRRQAN